MDVVMTGLVFYVYIQFSRTYLCGHYMHMELVSSHFYISPFVLCREYSVL